MEQTFFSFNILPSEADQQMGHEERALLININHIVSIKPINIVVKGGLIQGFWIRMSNGKKYRASTIPQALEALFKSRPHSLPQRSPLSEVPPPQHSDQLL